MLENFPIFSAWYDQLEVPESSRRGIPKGSKMPIAGKKFQGAALMLLLPRGLTTTDEIAEAAGTTGGTIRNWRGETEFRQLVCQHEDSFAIFILRKLSDVTPLKQLFLSPDEWKCWSDRIQQTLSLNIYNSLGDEISESSLWRIYIKRLSKQHLVKSFGNTYEDLGIPQVKLKAPDGPTRRSIWKGLANDAFLAHMSSKPVKQGRKMKSAGMESIEKRVMGYAIILGAYLDEIERSVALGKSTTKLKELYSYANANILQLIDILREGNLSHGK